jgi:uncharacterized protein YjbI with pentapeptide repeats
MNPTPITDTMDVFAEKFEGVDLHGIKISKSEFDDCTFVSCDFSETFFILANLPNAVLKTAI